MKDDLWVHNWGNGTDTIRIKNHHTVSTGVNTANSLFSIIDGPEPNGHIFWSYNPKTKAVHHLSSFGTIRAGVGQGSVNENGDLTLRIVFEGEPEDTYRIYNYTWRNADEYHMKSVQYDSNGAPTGLFYEGTFIRLTREDPTSTKTQIKAILAVLDNNAISVAEQLSVYLEDVVHMAPGNEVHIGKEALGEYLTQQRQYGETKMKHEIVELEAHGDIVIMRGEVTGTYYPKDKTPPVAFSTKNLFVFKATGGTLKIEKVIYNSSPNP